MRKLIIGLVGAVTLLTAPLAMPSAASAEPRYEIWKCWNLRANTETISRTKYYTCVGGVIQIWYTDTGLMHRKLDGSCANRVWNDSRRTATYHVAVRKCTTWVR